MEQRLASLNWLASKRNRYVDVFSGKSQANGRKNEERCKREGEQGEEKLQEGRFKRRIYKKILRVANRRDHAADIGGDGLKDDDSREMPLFVRDAEGENGKRNKCQQCDIVRHNHGGEEGEGNKKEAKLPESRDFREKAIRAAGKHAGVLKACRCAHQAKQKNNNAKVDR